jgi:hypothetical protein
MAGRSGYGNRPDQTRAVPEMLNDLAHIVAEELHLRPCEESLKANIFAIIFEDLNTYEYGFSQPPPCTSAQTMGCRADFVTAAWAA